MECERSTVTSSSAVQMQPKNVQNVISRTKLDDIDHHNTDAKLDSVSQRQFDLLRPVTIAVMGGPTVFTLSQLITVIEHLPDSVEDCIVDYVMFPLSHHLKLTTRLKEEEIIRLHDCLKLVLTKWEIPKFKTFIELYQLFMMFVGKQKDPGSFDKTLSEAVVERVVTSTHALFYKSLMKNFKKLYSERYIGSVGHGICILLQIVNHDTKKSLRILAIRTIMYLIRICENDTEACHRIFKFLPGLATTFVRCALTHGGRFQVDIIKESLAALKATLITCISSEPAESLVPVDTNLSSGIIEISDCLLFHDDQRLRAALADFSVSALQNTNLKLPKCAETLWKNMLVFAGDFENEESTKCVQFLKLPSNRNFVSVLCNFKTIELHLKKAVIQLNIGESAKSSLTAHGLAGALAVTSLSLAEFQSVLPRIVDLRATVVRHQVLNNEKLLQLPERQIISACRRMCQFIVEVHHDEADLFVAEFHTLLELSDNKEDVTSFRSAGIVLLLNDILQSFTTKRPAKADTKLIEEIIETYVSRLGPLPSVVSFSPCESQQPLPPSKSNQRRVDLTSDECSALDVHVCSILDGLPILTTLEPVLLQHLMPLLQYAGLQERTYDSIRVKASEILTQLARVSNCTVREYLSLNLDYIMSELMSRTEVITNYPLMSDALIFLAEYFDFSQSRFLALIEHIIQLSTSQNFEINYHIMFANIYHAYVLSIWKHYYEEKPIVDKIPSEAFVERLLRYQQAYGVVPPSEDDEDGVQAIGDNLDGLGLAGGAAPVENEAVDAEPEEKIPLPPEISLTLRIARKAADYLAGETREIKLMSIEILIKAIEVLSTYENELLPLLHQSWETLAARFQDREYVVLRKAFELLLTMVNHSGDFLRKRTIEGIFPMLSIFLEELSGESDNIDPSDATCYTFSQGFRLQMTILVGLPVLCEAMEVGERDLDNVAEACLIYLAPTQHKELREEATELLLNLADGPHGASIWMKLIACGVIEMLDHSTNKEFKKLPKDFAQSFKEAKSKQKPGRNRFRK